MKYSYFFKKRDQYQWLEKMNRAKKQGLFISQLLYSGDTVHLLPEVYGIF